MVVCILLSNQKLEEATERWRNTKKETVVIQSSFYFTELNNYLSDMLIKNAPLVTMAYGILYYSLPFQYIILGCKFIDDKWLLLGPLHCLYNYRYGFPCPKSISWNEESLSWCQLVLSCCLHCLSVELHNLPIQHDQLNWNHKKTTVSNYWLQLVTRGSKMPQKAGCAGSNKVSDCCNYI